MESEGVQVRVSLPSAGKMGTPAEEFDKHLLIVVMGGKIYTDIYIGKLFLTIYRIVSF